MHIYSHHMSKLMIAEHIQIFLMQEPPHVLRYVALGVGIAVAAGIAAYVLHRRSRAKTGKVAKA
jgi:hypothetical protein